MQKNTSNRSTKRRKDSNRRKMISTIIVIFVLVAIMLVVALFAGGGAKEPASSVSLPAAVSSAVLSSVPPVSSSGPVGDYDEAGIPALFNATHPIPETYTMDLVSIGNNHTMDAPAARAYLAMAEAAKSDGVKLVPISGYRTHERQTNNYNASIQRYVDQGKTKEEATKLTQDYYAIPGTSEHEAGLAVDVNSLDDSFENTPEFKWLQENAQQFGFILRYRRETKEITRVNYEPWHYRYVGTNHAARINELDITLEEYVELLNTEQKP